MSVPLRDATVVARDQHMAGLEPWFAVGAGYGSVKLAVPASQVELAREILRSAAA